MTRIAVIGAGSWGTAFATLPAEKGLATTVWARREDLAENIRDRHRNPDYLPDAVLPPALTGTHEMEEAVKGADVVVMAIPSHAFRGVFREVLEHVDSKAPVVSLTKGVEQDSLKRMTEVLKEEGDLPPWRIALLTGPNLAKEIALRQPAASVIASTDESCCAELQEIFRTPYFRVYTNPDIVGCELGGALKNVIAIAAGIADGMGFGDNSKAALLTRGLAELTRLGVALGGKPLTFQGLAGMGDLIATCGSKLSRNHYVGEQLGKGRKLDEIIEEMNMVAEGVKTSKAVVELAATVDVDVPIAEHVAQVLYEGMSPEEMVQSLMRRPVAGELEGIDIHS